MASSGITFVSSDLEKKEFIEFPYRHYATDGFFVPPLRSEQKKLIDTDKNPFFKQAKMAMFLAEHNGKPAGRIAAVVDDRFNKQHGLNTGHFAFFECIDHQPTADLMFRVAEDWLKEQGVEEVLGPTNPGMMDVLGFLVDGFDKYPYIMMAYSKPYYEKLALNAGYTGVRDLLAFVVDQSSVDFDRMRKAKSMIMRRYPEITIRPVSLKRISEEVKIVRDIYNEAWKDNWGFLPLTLEELTGLAKEFKMILDEDFAHIAEWDGKPVGFSIALPDLNQVFKTMNGNLLPFGFIKFLWGKRKINRIRTALMGILPEYQGKGIDALFHQRTIENALVRKYVESELSWVLDNNTEMIHVAERLGARIDKRYRMYAKKLEV